MSQPATVEDVPTEEEANRLEEGVPLLPKGHDSPRKISQSRSFAEHRQSIADQGLHAYTKSLCYDGEDMSDITDTAHNGKMLFYDQNSLLTARSVLHIGLSAFTQAPVISTLVYCSVICTVAAAAVFVMPKSSKLDTKEFEAFGTFLKVFIAFMLGTYVTNAFTRWWYSVTSFEQFLGSIQQMLFMLHTIRGRPDWRKMVERYCMASCYILNAEVRNVHTVDVESRVDLDQLLDWLARNGFLSEDEADVLKVKVSPINICSKTRAIWSWIGELVSHPVCEEDASVAPPLLVRTIVLCQSCINEIELLKMNISMQVPFMYAHLLSILVHINNIMLSLSCGFSLGSSMNEIRRRSEQLSGVRDTSHPENSVMGQLYGAAQVCGIQIITVLLIPMCYVAFLHISHMLCYPFGDHCYNLPTETLIARLQVDLNRMSDQRAYFRQKHAEWKVMEKERALKHMHHDDAELDGDDDDGDDDCD